MPGLRDPMHWVVLVLVIVVIFGWKKLPDASRSLARSLRIFKNELTSGNEESPRGPVTGEVVDPAARRTDEPTGSHATSERPADGDR